MFLVVADSSPIRGDFEDSLSALRLIGNLSLIQKLFKEIKIGSFDFFIKKGFFSS